MNDGSQSLIGHSALFKGAGEVAAIPQLGDSLLDRLCARQPVVLAVTVALHKPGGRLLAVTSLGHLANLNLHQLLGGKQDRVAQISVS